MQNLITNAQNDREIIFLWLGDKSPTTQVNYRSTISRFLQFVDKPLSDIRLEDLQLWEKGLKARFKDTTVTNKVLVIKSLFSFCVSVGWLNINIGSFLKTPKAKNTIAERILDAD